MDVDLYEKNNYFGGHTHTQTISSSENEIDVDSGFIVFNQINYPNLCKLFNELKVENTKAIRHFLSNRSENFRIFWYKHFYNFLSKIKLI